MSPDSKREVTCTGCTDGLPTRPCSVSGRRVHRGPDFSFDCRAEVTAESLTDEQIREVERSAVGQLYLDCLDATTAEPFEPRHLERWLRMRTAARTRVAAAINARKAGAKWIDGLPRADEAAPVLSAEERDEAWIPPSRRVPEPGPCTAMAHCWNSGAAVCNCGGATRDGDCRGWRVASRLTDAEIVDRLLGGGK